PSTKSLAIRPVPAIPQRNPIALALPNMRPDLPVDGGSGSGESDGRPCEPGAPRRGARMIELVRLFAWLGIIGVGGPAAHIAMMRRHVVERKCWMSEDDFTRLVGACALVPGPNSTEMAMALGSRRAGWRGLVASGVAFIVPAFAIVCVIAFLYEDVLTSALIADARRLVVPIVAAIVLDALWSLRRVAVRDRLDVLTVLIALASAVLGVPELLVLLAVGMASLLLRATETSTQLGVLGVPLVVPFTTQLVVPSLAKLFLVFLQIGSVIYGSGYVLLVFLDSEVVERGWITSEVLLDAISVGQFTPGPVFTTATFIGWHIAGIAGAAVATLGIFGPSFVFAGLIDRVVALSQRSRTFSAFLRGVSSGSIALMVIVMWRLAGEAFVDGRSMDRVAVAAFVVVFALIRGRAWQRTKSVR
ncbi:MAG: chromate efflux transporter, partial [Ilumatobacteraceae bacterium]